MGFQPLQKLIPPAPPELHPIHVNSAATNVPVAPTAATVHLCLQLLLSICRELHLAKMPPHRSNSSTISSKENKGQRTGPQSDVELLNVINLRIGIAQHPQS